VSKKDFYFATQVVTTTTTVTESTACLAPVQSPVFLLFLDCVAHLRRQFPADFEFSDVYLVRVWDSLCTGAFRTFAFNSVHDYQSAVGGLEGRRGSNGVVRQQTSLYAFHPSVWDWSVQFNDAQLALNFEPLYAAKREMNGLKSSESKTSASTNGDRTLTRIVRQTTLRPNVKLFNMKLWSLCYLRWISPIAIVGGGAASEYLAHCLLVEEIHSLRGKIANCESTLNGGGGGADRRRSVLVFGGRTGGLDDIDGNGEDWSSPLNESLPEVSSSFPFTDCRVNVARLNLSIDAYCEGNSFRSDFTGADDESFATRSDSFVIIDENESSQTVENSVSDKNGEV
jgi:Myotubularin-like phosphatase domain/Myotubularin-associated protein